MATGTINLGSPRELLFDAILDEVRSWAELPRRIFTQVHYSGKSVNEIASQAGCSAPEVSRILETHERRLRSALRVYRS